MRSLACCAAILCLWGSVRAQDNSDMQDVFDRITTEIIRGTYTARVEVTRLKDTGTNKTEEKTYTMVEYHDSSTGLHSLEMTSLNIRKFFYQKLASGTVATVDAGNKCNVQKVEDAAQEPESFIFKSNHAIDPEYFLGPSTVLVQVASDLMNWTAVPDEQVRGINALRYSNYGRKDADKKSIDIWFADDWKINKLSANDVPFPLRIWIEENNVTDQFDFYQVQDLSPKEVFRLGSNLQLPFESESCAFPEPGIEPASLLRTFSFSSSDGSVSAKEYFSKDDNLYRADVAGSTVIHDDEHGLIYKLGKGCKVEPNPAVNPKVLSTGSFNPGARLVQAYLSLPKKMYIGEGFVRGIPVDIWDVVGANEGATLKKARFFFAKPAAVLSANGDEGSQPLVKAMVLDSLEHDEVLDVDVYDFASSMDDQDFKKNFIIEDCVEASTFVEIGFRATTSFNEEEFKLSNAMKELIQAVGARIRETTGVSALQLPSIKAEVKDGSDITVLVKILAPPPYLKSFAEPRGPFKHYEGSPRDSPDTEDCARECIQKGCKTFLSCGPKCQLMTDSDSSKWGKEITGSAQDCYAYDHVPTTDTMTRPSLDKISFLLENSVMWLWEPFKVSMSQNRSVSLQASTFFDHLTQFNKQGSLGPYKLQFSGLSINPDDASATLVEKIPTVGQCYQQCKTNKDMACSSFSLCPTTQRCVLTSKNINAGTEHDVGQNETLQKATQDCQILSMNYLSEFDRLDGKTRKSGSLANTKATTAGDCAVKCRQSTLEAIETCRSFDFCPKRGTCYYYRTHYGWDGKDDALVNDGDCDHYALRYSASFSAVAKGVFTGKPATIVSSVSFEECAKQCSERSNEECKTISYCDSNVPDKDKMTCYMYALNVEDLFDSTNRESSCTVYTKDEAIVDEIINPRRAIEKEITDHRIGMGNGAFAFLLIAMLAVGAVLGVSGWLQRERITSFIGRSGGSSASGTTISYNRQDNENTNGEA